MNDLQK
jgi:hypothetical protein